MAITPSSQTLIDSGNRLFKERMPLLQHWQEIAELFYYERADFTAQHAIGADYAAGSITSVPALARREMGNLYRSMLRPLDFFEVKAMDDERNKDDDAHAWLQYATRLMRSVMYRKGGNFTRATVAGDHDHVAFGQAVVEVCATPDRSAVYYRTWHLRDVAWSEDYAGSVQDIHRNCMVTIRSLMDLFPGKVPQKLQDDAKKDPHKKIKARHVVVPSDAYEFDFKVRPDHPWVSMWVLPDEGVTLEKISRAYRGYIIPRADTVSGSQYARSPFTSIILPDARTKNAIERILLEAGEKAVDPPMIATMDALRSDIGLYAGGITWVDIEYDERLGEALRPVNQDYSGLPFGDDMSMRYDQIIREGMMLTKVNLPETNGDMTAYQVRKIMEQHMRAHIPMFEPVEVEYNEPLCSETFTVMRTLGAFPANEIPPALQSADVEFQFRSPIRDIEDDSKAQKLREGAEVLQIGAAIDPSVAQIPDAMEIVKSNLKAIGWPVEWMRNDKQLAEMIQAAQEQQQAQEAAAAAMTAAEGAGKAAPMVKAVADMGRAA